MRANGRVILRLIACGLVLCVSPAARALDRVEEFKQAKPAIGQLAKSTATAQRVEACQKLAAFPIADATKMLNGLLADGQVEVRDAAYRALLSQSGYQEVCDVLLPLAKTASQKKNQPGAAAPLLAVLLSSNLPSVRRDTVDILEKSLLQVSVALADELGRHCGEIDVAPLSQLSKTKIFADNYAVRRAVVDALIKIRCKAAVGALIDLLPGVRGEDGADALEYLAQLTEMPFGKESAAWQTWWSESKDEFQYPARFVQAPYRSATVGNDANYYGLPVVAKRLVFVIDTSGSMNGARIMAAKRELLNAIDQLSEDQFFSVVAFDSTVTVWNKQLVKATTPAKRQASNFVSSLEARSDTASYDAIEAAFRFDTEAVYFLSDGAPTSGKIVAPPEIVAAVTATNSVRRISLYTIGVGAGVPGSPLDEFLRALAGMNYGLYHRVDE